MWGEGMLIILLLVLHLIVCGLCLAAMSLGILKCGRRIFWMVLLVPVWGLVCCLFLEWRTRSDVARGAQVGVEKMKINDEIYRSILISEDKMEHQVVPLEEALLLNSNADRRKLMLDVMYANPEDYVTLLQEARSNDDTEVVHYAVTALVELQKKYDLEFQNLDRRMGADPGNITILEEYIALEERYLNSGLLEGADQQTHRRGYSNLLAKRLEKGTKDINWYRKKAEVDLQLLEYDSAYRCMEYMMANWPKEESGYLLCLQYYAAVGDRAGIDRVIDQLKSREVYLSPNGRDQVRFWNR